MVKRSNELLTDARRLIIRIDSLLGPESTFNRTLENVERITENSREFSERFDNYGRLLERTMASLDSAAVGIRTAVDSSAGGANTAHPEPRHAGCLCEPSAGRRRDARRDHRR